MLTRDEKPTYDELEQALGMRDQTIADLTAQLAVMTQNYESAVHGRSEFRSAFTNLQEELRTAREACAAQRVKIDDLTAQLTAMTQERDEAYKLLYGARCIYCGVVVADDCHNQDIGDLQLAAHVEQCEKHPMFKLKQQLTAMTQAHDTIKTRLEIKIQELTSALTPPPAAELEQPDVHPGKYQACEELPGSY